MEFYKINDKNNLEPSDKERFQARKEDNCSLHLVLILYEEFQQQKNFIETLDLHPLILEKLNNNGDDIGAVPYKDAILIKFPLPNTWEDSVKHYGTLVCMQNSIILFTDKIQTFGRKLLADLSKDAIINNSNTAGIIYFLFDRNIYRLTKLVKQGRKEINSLYQQLEQGRREDFNKNLQVLRGRESFLEETLDDLHRCVNSLLGINTSILELTKIEEYFRDLLNQIEHLLRQIERINDERKTIYKYYLLKLQDATNRRLNILTIVTAIFMPLTLIAGIYGMNFTSMPVLEWQFGYPAILIIMMVISICLVLAFYLKGWFD